MKIKRKKQLNLPQLIEWAMENDVTDRMFLTENSYCVGFDRHKIAIESCVKKVHEQQGTIEKAESITNELEEVYLKAKAFEEIKKHVDKEVDFYMALYRETKDPTYSLLNSHYDALLGYIEELDQ